ncbi:MAG: hypothetical protein NVS9B10_12960 [Nevskia sp.]
MMRDMAMYFIMAKAPARRAGPGCRAQIATIPGPETRQSMNEEMRGRERYRPRPGLPFTLVSAPFAPGSKTLSARAASR